MSMTVSVSHQDLLTCRPDLHDSIQQLTQADLDFIQQAVHATLEETYWSTLRWILEYHTHFDGESRAESS
jgi:hypothetical protein